MTGNATMASVNSHKIDPPSGYILREENGSVVVVSKIAPGTKNDMQNAAFSLPAKLGPVKPTNKSSRSLDGASVVLRDSSPKNNESIRHTSKTIRARTTGTLNKEYSTAMKSETLLCVIRSFLRQRKYGRRRALGARL